MFLFEMYIRLHSQLGRNCKQSEYARETIRITLSVHTASHNYVCLKTGNDDMKLKHIKVFC